MTEKPINPAILEDSQNWRGEIEKSVYLGGKTDSSFWSREAALQEAKMKFSLYFLPFMLASGIDLKSADMLEIGCGIGRFGYYIAPMVHAYTGVDFIEKVLDEARAILREYDNCKLVLNDGMTLEDIGDESQDLAFAFRSLSHAHNTEIVYSYLRETVRVLKKDGIAKLEIRGANARRGCRLHWLNIDSLVSGGENGNLLKRKAKHLLGCLPADLQLPILSKYSVEGLYGEGVPYNRAVEFVEKLGAFATVSPLQGYLERRYSSNLSNAYWLYVYKDKDRKVIRA